MVLADHLVALIAVQMILLALRSRDLTGKAQFVEVAMFDGLDVAALPFNALENLLDDPHLAEVELFQNLDHVGEGTVQHVGLPNTFSGGHRQPHCQCQC